MGIIILLLALGLILLFIEVFLMPGFGVAGIGGLLSFGWAVVRAFMDFPTWVGIVVLAGCMLLVVLFLIFALRAKTWEKLSLKQEIDTKAVESPAEAGITVGMEGVSLTRLGPGGHASFDGKEIEVCARGGMIGPDTPVKVVAVDGLRVFVTSL